MGSAACSAGTIKITLAEPTEEESEEEESTEATAPSSPPSFRVTDMVPCIAYFDYGEWRCTFNCIQKSALDNFSEFVLDKTKKVMKRDTESQELYPVGILYDAPYSFELGRRLLILGVGMDMAMNS